MSTPTNPPNPSFHPTNRLHTICRWPLDPAERRKLAIVDLHYVRVMRRVLFPGSGAYPLNDLDQVEMAAMDVLGKLKSGPAREG